MHSVMIKSTVTGVRILALPLGGPGPQTPNLHHRAIMINWNNACEVLSMMSDINNNKQSLLIFLLNYTGNFTDSTTNYHHGNELARQQLQISATDKQKRLKD